MGNKIAAPEPDLARIAHSLRDSAQVPVTTMHQAQNLLTVCETLRQPVKREWLMGRIATLLSHFYVSQLSETEMRAIAADWNDALCDMPEWAVAEACREYVRTQDRKPTPAAIRNLARQHFAIVEYTRHRAMRGPVQTTEDRPQLTDAERADRAKRLAEMGNQTARAMKFSMEKKA